MVCKSHPTSHLSITLFVLFCVVSGWSQGYGVEKEPDTAELPRPLTVADSIQMVQLADPSNIALYSPDGTTFLTVLRKGKLEDNTNEYSLLLWKTDALFHSSPRVLLIMSSSSNRAAIENPQWLGDDETVAFLGEHPGELHQLYTINIRTGVLRKVTNHPTNLTWFSMTPNGDAIAFTAEASDESFFDANTRRVGFVISTEPLVDLIRDRKERELYSEQLFFQPKEGTARILTTTGALKSESYYGPPTLSPDGKYIVLTTHLHAVPNSWTEYDDPTIRQLAMEKLRPRQYSWLYTYELVDTHTGQSRILVDAPIGIFGTECFWSSESDTVVISDTFLPLRDTEGKERKSRQSHSYALEVRIPTGEITEISPDSIRLVGWVQNTNYLESVEVDAYRAPKPQAPSLFFSKTADKWERVMPEIVRVNHPSIALEQGMNMPPRIFALDPTTHQKAVLLELNPQFKSLKFAKVEEIRWKGTDGHEVSGGLYYPLNYDAGKRYPLVIQTHGWTSQAFLMDGIFPAPFAAQALAAKDIAVLQADERFDNQNTPEEVKREAATIEGAVDYLDQKKLIDRERVGIIGFSRTCLFVKYLLTHSNYQFAAASLEDGIDAGYWQYLAAGTSVPDAWPSVESINGGVPFGKGLQSWLERSPGFGIENVRAPVRIVSANSDSLLYQWEWFAVLTRLGKPVEMVYLRDGEHILQKPWDRMVAQQGNVDWFCFWLKGEEDRDPDKAVQYARWRAWRHHP
jgi:hypothetical protein